MKVSSFIVIGENPSVSGLVGLSVSRARRPSVVSGKILSMSDPTQPTRKAIIFATVLPIDKRSSLPSSPFNLPCFRPVPTNEGDYFCTWRVLRESVKNTSRK